MEDKGKEFLKERFILSDNSAMEYNSSLLIYLDGVMKNTRFEAMSEHQLYLQGAKQMLEEIINLLEKEFEGEYLT